jgi:hypothetical protein
VHQAQDGGSSHLIVGTCQSCALAAVMAITKWSIRLKRGLTPKIVAVQLDQVEAVKEMLSSWWRSRFGAR